MYNTHDKLILQIILRGQNGVKSKIKKGANSHFGSNLHEKTPEINDFRCFFGCGGGI